jgi:hypothetical protein
MHGDQDKETERPQQPTSDRDTAHEETEQGIAGDDRAADAGGQQADEDAASSR